MTVQPRGIPLRPAYGALREQAMGTLVRSVITAANTRLNPNVTTESFVRRRWGDRAMDDVAPMLRAASAPASTATTGWAKELTQTTLASLANLIPLSAGADLLDRGLKLTFDGAATVNIPNLTAPLADFVGQNAPTPVVSATSSIQASLAPCKFGVIVVLSREVLDSSNAEALTRQALLDAMAPSLDRRLFDSTAAVADLRPAGLLYGKVAMTPSADTNKLSAMVADLSTLAASVAPLAGNGGNGGLCFIAAAKQAVAIAIGSSREFPYAVLTSTSLAAGTVICVAVNAVVSALGAAPQIDITRAATLHMDTAPQAIASGGTMPSPTEVTFQNDTVGVRLRWPLSWALRNTNAIAFISAATWP
jgi:hypothetical protein